MEELEIREVKEAIVEILLLRGSDEAAKAVTAIELAELVDRVRR